MDLQSQLIAGVIFSSIGLGYFAYGRRQNRPVPKYSGVALLAFPYFVPDLFWLLAIGAGLIALPGLLRI